MLWDVVRDFFVQHIFGVVDSAGTQFAGKIGSSMSNVDDVFHVGTATISMGDWLSTTASVVVLIALSFVAFRFVWWLTKVVGGLLCFRR